MRPSSAAAKGHQHLQEDQNHRGPAEPDELLFQAFQVNTHMSRGIMR